MKTALQRFEEKCTKSGTDECWPWMGATNKGYGVLYYEGRPRPATHVALAVYRGLAVQPGLQACHTCDNPICVNPSHLFIGTPLENKADCDAKGRARYLVGHAHPQAKLKDADIPEIRRLRAGGMLYRDIAEKFHISREAASNVARGNNWRHVP